MTSLWKTRAIRRDRPKMAEGKVRNNYVVYIDPARDLKMTPARCSRSPWVYETMRPATMRTGCQLKSAVPLSPSPPRK